MPKPPTPINRAAARDVINALSKQYPGTLLGDPAPAVLVSSGSLALDLMLGGGYAKGRIIELFGVEGSGKTSICLAAIESFQSLGLSCSIVDVENALDATYMQAAGVSLAPDDLSIWQPDGAEEALDIVEKLVPVTDLIVLDSIAMLSPRAELEGKLGDSHVGLLPRLLGQWTRRITPTIKRHGTVVLLVNQIRMKVGVLYGNPETTPGGKAVGYAASTRLDVRRGSELDVKETVGGTPRVTSVGAKVTARKLKTGAPFGVALVPLLLGKGVDHGRETAIVARDYGLLDLKGHSARYEGELLGVGKDAIIERLRRDAPLRARLDAAIRAQYAASGQKERAVAALEEEVEAPPDERSEPA